MFEKQPRLLIMLSLLSGLIGGVLATFLLGGSSVVAQPAPADTPKTVTTDIPKTISAQEFHLVDIQGPCSSHSRVYRERATFLATAR